RLHPPSPRSSASNRSALSPGIVAACSIPVACVGECMEWFAALGDNGGCPATVCPMSGDPAFPTLPTSPPLPTPPTGATEPLAARERSRIPATQADDAFEGLIRIAAAICRVPMAMVTLVGADRQWLKARLGIPVRETGRDESFC